MQCYPATIVITSSPGGQGAPFNNLSGLNLQDAERPLNGLSFTSPEAARASQENGKEKDEQESESSCPPVRRVQQKVEMVRGKCRHPPSGASVRCTNRPNPTTRRRLAAPPSPRTEERNPQNEAPTAASTRASADAIRRAPAVLVESASSLCDPALCGPSLCAS